MDRLCTALARSFLASSARWAIRVCADTLWPLFKDEARKATRTEHNEIVKGGDQRLLGAVSHCTRSTEERRVACGKRGQMEWQLE